MRISLIPVLFAAVLAVNNLQAQMIGYRGDGSGVFPNAKPPTSALAVKWEAPLPGWGHGSPVAVGDKVFVVVEPYPGQYFPGLLCFEASSGKQLWQRSLDHTNRLRRQRLSHARLRRHGGVRGHRVRRVLPCRSRRQGRLGEVPSRHPGEYCRNGRSPILYKNLLISDITGKVRAIEKETGALKWSHPVDNETVMTPAIITVNKTDILLCFNKKAFRLPDGVPLTVEGGTDFGATTIVKYDERDVVFSIGGGEHGGWTQKGATALTTPSAVRYRLEGDKLVGQVLWTGIEGQKQSSHTGVTYHDGKLYRAKGVVLEALTGKVLAGNPKQVMAARHRRRIICC